jgi:hydroxymethylbilane synthase
VSTSSPSTLRIATRASSLALWQARYIAEAIAAIAPGTKVELVQVTTTGDRDQTGALRAFGGLGVFTREVQKAVLDRRADLAVHSLKDLPTESAQGLCLAAVPEREDTADALVLSGSNRSSAALDRLPKGARVGTGSLRRRAQLLSLRPDLLLEEVRGNVETRISRLDAGDYDALVLAVAGLKRLGLQHRISATLAPPVMFAAAGQGALGIECRDDDTPVRGLLLRLEDTTARARVTAERALLARLRAGCHAPVGAATEFQAGQISLEAVVLSADGRQRIVARDESASDDAAGLGARVADRLLELGAEALIRE